MINSTKIVKSASTDPVYAATFTLGQNKYSMVVRREGDERVLNVGRIVVVDGKQLKHGFNVKQEDVRLFAAELLRAIEWCDAGTGSLSINRAREQHPRAFEKWLPHEDDQLRQLHADGIPRGEIAAKLQRQPGAIEAREKKLGLIPK